jgi:sporulation protein YlmC with PRC-barrel domain
MNRRLLCTLGLLGLSLGILGQVLLAADKEREPRRQNDRAVQRDGRDVTIDADVRVSEELPAALGRVSDIKGIHVYAKDGEELGEVQELVLDLHGGCVRYAVLSFGGFLGIGDKYFAVPWHAMTLNRTDDRDQHFVINIDAERLKGAPGFSQDKWPDFANEKFSVEIDKFYGVDRRHLGFRPGERGRHREGDRDRDRGAHRDRSDRDRADDGNRDRGNDSNRDDNPPATPDNTPADTPPADNTPADTNPPANESGDATNP